MNVWGVCMWLCICELGRGEMETPFFSLHLSSDVRCHCTGIMIMMMRMMMIQGLHHTEERWHYEATGCDPPSGSRSVQLWRDPLKTTCISILKLQPQKPTRPNHTLNTTHEQSHGGSSLGLTVNRRHVAATSPRHVHQKHQLDATMMIIMRVQYYTKLTLSVIHYY